MSKFYTVFNLARASIQMPNKGYLMPHPDPKGYDRAFPVEIPEGHLLWKMAQPQNGKGPQIRIVEGDVPWPEKVKPAAPPPVVAKEEEAPVSLLPQVEVPVVSESENPGVVGGDVPAAGAADPQVSEQDDELARLTASLNEDAEDPEVPELETELEPVSMEASATAPASNRPLSRKEKKALQKQGRK